MKAVVHSQYGDREVLQVATLARPVPQNNEVLIRVKAAGLDDGQWHLMTGQPYAMRLATGLTRPKQRVLGVDVSGVVEAVGAKVTRCSARRRGRSRGSPARAKTSYASSSSA